jgi:hypothetical protein
MTTAEISEDRESAAPAVFGSEVPIIREERRFTDLLREGKSLTKNDKIKRLVNSLKWRHRYQNTDHYSIELHDERVITVQQVSNGEIMGLGTGVSVWPAAHVLSKYLEKRYGSDSLCGQRVCDIGSGTGCTGVNHVYINLIVILLSITPYSIHNLMRVIYLQSVVIIAVSWLHRRPY